MTKWAVVFIVAGLALYLVAGQTQVGWLYLFDAIIWSVLVLSAVLPRYDLKSLRVEQHLLLPAMGYQRLFLNGPLEDESIEIQFKITNSGRLSRYFIKLAADCPFEQPQARRKSFFLVALKHGITTFSYTASCYRRGYYDSSQIILESGGPLGLFARRRKVELPLNLTVYPRYYPMSTSLVAGEEWVERGQGVKASSASEFYGSRNYQYGDPLKHVHWRNTARTGHFMIKEFEQAGQGSLIVAIDTSRDFGEGRETTLEYSVKIAASLAKLCADSGRRLDIISGRDVLHNADWPTAMDFLARLEVSEKTVPSNLSAVSNVWQTIVTILPAAATHQTPALLKLAGQGHGRGTVMLLEGFASEAPGEPMLLRGTSLEVIHCAQGGLETAIDRLGRHLSMNSGAGNAG